jgi:hypothetical protein
MKISDLTDIQIASDDRRSPKSVALQLPSARFSVPPHLIPEAVSQSVSQSVKMVQ